MEFRLPYLLAMRERAPQMFNQLRRSGQMDAHLEQKVQEAARMLKEMLPENPTLAAEREAEEVVRATLIEFPSEESARRRTPPRL
ncbi:MAG: hypothetical protein KF769_10415 [Parvibaculum sp.]|nr:hypothetical protein [Parvibaculum sp.]